MAMIICLDRMWSKQGQRSKTDLEAHMNQLLMPVIPLGINSYEVVKLYTKYHPVVPDEVLKILRRRRLSEKIILQR